MNIDPVGTDLSILSQWFGNDSYCLAKCIKYILGFCEW